VDNLYKVTIKNPSANPSELEEEYITADSDKDAELAALDLVARHPFDDVSLVSVELVEPGDLYHDEETTSS